MCALLQEFKNVSPQFLKKVVCKHSKTDFYHMTSQVKTLTAEILTFGCLCKEKVQHSTHKGCMINANGLYLLSFFK